MNNWICLNRLPWAFGEVLLQLLLKVNLNLNECSSVSISERGRNQLTFFVLLWGVFHAWQGCGHSSKQLEI